MEITRDVARKVLEVVDAGLVKGLGKPVPGQMCVEAAVCYVMGLPHSDEPSCVAPALRSFKIRLNDADWSSDAARAKGMRRLALVQLGSAGHLDEREFARRLADFAVRKVVPRALRVAASVHPSAEHRLKLEEAAVRCANTADARFAASAAADAAWSAADAAAADAADARFAASAAADAAWSAARSAASSASSASSAWSAAARSAARSADADAASSASARFAARSAARFAASAAADAAARSAADAADAADAAKYAARDKELAWAAEEVVQILVDMNVPGAQWLDLTGGG